MGDFLSNLVTRSTTVSAASLRPRPVSIYESGRSAPPGPAEDRQAQTAEDNPRTGPTSAPQREVPRGRSFDKRQLPEDSLAWLEAWRKQYLTREADANSALPAQPGPHQQGIGEAPRAASLRPEPLRENRLVESVHQVAREIVTQPPLHSPTIAPAQPGMAAMPARDSAGSRPEFHDRGEATVLNPTPKTAELSAIRPALPPAIMPTPAEASRQAQPTIHVSIGRIEVRLNAAPGQAATSPARKTAAVMSLEDYLRTRNGGGR